VLPADRGTQWEPSNCLPQTCRFAIQLPDPELPQQIRAYPSRQPPNLCHPDRSAKRIYPESKSKARSGEPVPSGVEGDPEQAASTMTRQGVLP
jgi:hypothetical protein